VQFLDLGQVQQVLQFAHGPPAIGIDVHEGQQRASDRGAVKPCLDRPHRSAGLHAPHALVDGGGGQVDQLAQFGVAALGIGGQRA